MDYEAKMRGAYERSVRGLAKRPELGKVTRSVTARMTEGLTCAIEGEGYRYTSDMPEIAGGNGRGAPPTLFLEVALASCLATDYRLSFAARGLPVNRIEVRVTTTFDVCGMYGLDDGKLMPDGPIAYAVQVDSPADEATVLEILDEADARSPLTNMLRRPVELRRELQHHRTDG